MVDKSHRVIALTTWKLHVLEKYEVENSDAKLQINP